METLLVWLEGSALGQLMRASGVWAYGVVNLIHIFGIVVIFLGLVFIDGRLVKGWRKAPA